MLLLLFSFLENIKTLMDFIVVFCDEPTEIIEQ